VTYFGREKIIEIIAHVIGPSHQLQLSWPAAEPFAPRQASSLRIIGAPVGKAADELGALEASLDSWGGAGEGARALTMGGLGGWAGFGAWVGAGAGGRSIGTTWLGNFLESRPKNFAPNTYLQKKKERRERQLKILSQGSSICGKKRLSCPAIVEDPRL
jgi:hypothetical protein